MDRRKYNTEEERKTARKAYMAEYRANHKEELAAKKAEWYQQNKEKIASKNANYYQNNKEKILEQNAEYRANHKEELAAKHAEYYQNNKDEFVAKQAEYRSTPFGRAYLMVRDYGRADKKYNRGECTIDAQWIVDNIFSGQICHYCGETDWKKLGCDRKDSSLPHTPENVVCSCWDCNHKKNKTPYDEFMRKIGKIA